MSQHTPTRLRVSRAVLRQMIQVYGSEDAVVSAALEILMKRMIQKPHALTSPATVRDYLRLLLTPLEYEAFWCVFLDAQHRVIASEEMFKGTLTQTSVFPREVVKRALQLNASAVILAHNHPSGIAEPSRADEAITQTLKQVLALVDVKVLDHFVIGADKAMSFAEMGLL